MDAVKNFAKANLNAGITSGATSLVLTSGAGGKMPATPFNAVLFNSTDFSDPADDTTVEIVRVTNVSGDTLTITRAQEGTSASAHNTGAKTYTLVAGPTAKTMTDINRVAAIGYGATYSSHTGIVSGVSDNLVIPAGTLAVGDSIDIYGLWSHTGAMASAPRFGLDFGSSGANLVNISAVGTGDTAVEIRATVVITGATSQVGSGWALRIMNAVPACANALTMSEAISGAITLGFTYRMDATGETIQLLAASATVRKAP
jgi:hypothetical protein